LEGPTLGRSKAAREAEDIKTEVKKTRIVLENA